MIDGFRYGFLGHHDGNLTLGLAMMTLVNIALLLLCYWMFRSGYKLRP
jgi:ABC-2 type transport system permease protein